jgi:HEAT repeat protein
MMFLLLAGWVVAAVGDGTPVTSAGAKEQERVLAEKHLTNEQSGLRFRAAFRLGLLAENDPKAAEVLLKEIFRESGGRNIFWEMHLLGALSRSTCLAPSEVVAAFQGSERQSTRDLELLLALLGHMGPRGKEAVPFLLEQIAAKKGDQRLQGEIRAVILNVGGATDGDPAAIASEIAAQSEIGMGAVHMMGLVTCSDWVTDEIVGELIKWLSYEGIADHPGNAIIDAVLALGLTGDKASVAVPQLKRQMELAARDDRGSYYIACGLSLAQIDTKNRAKYLREVLAFCAEDWDRTHILLFQWHGLNVHEYMISTIAEFLSAPDEGTVGQTLYIMQFLGPAVHQVVPEVMRLLGSAQSEEVCSHALGLLSLVAGESAVHDLKELRRRTQSDATRKEVNRCIAKIEYRTAP